MVLLSEWGEVMEFQGLGVVTDLLNWMIANPGWGTVVMAVFGPFCMVCLAGLVMEGRLVHLIKGQSLSFFPGEVILIATMAITFNEARYVPADYWIWWQDWGAVLALVVAAVLSWLMRKIYDAPAYNMTPGATGNSATKLAHDIFGYLWYPFVLLTVGLPVIVYGLTAGSSERLIWTIVMIASFAAWLGLDAVFDSRRIGWDMAAMHPDDSHTWYRRALIKAQRTVTKVRNGCS